MMPQPANSSAAMFAGELARNLANALIDGDAIRAQNSALSEEVKTLTAKVDELEREIQRLTDQSAETKSAKVKAA